MKINGIRYKENLQKSDEKLAAVISEYENRFHNFCSNELWENHHLLETSKYLHLNDILENEERMKSVVLDYESRIQKFRSAKKCTCGRYDLNF